MGIYGTKNEIESSTKEIKDIFKNLSSLTGSAGDEHIKKKVEQAQAINEKHKRTDNKDQLKSIDQLEKEKS